MKIDFLDQEQGYSRAQVEIDWVDCKADYEDCVRAYARLPIPGFRAGKIPKHVVEKRFQHKIAEDLSLRWVQRIDPEALNKADSATIGPLEVYEPEVVKGRWLKLVLRYLSMPAFDLPNFNTMHISKESEDPLSELSDWLLSRVTVSPPDALIEAELGADGVEPIVPGSDAWAAAAERVKLMLILKKIAAAEGIVVDESDVTARIKAKAAEFGTTAGELSAQLNKGGGIGRLRDLLVAESTLEYLLDNFGT